MNDIVRVENGDGPVASLVLNRPERKNALSWEMFERLPAEVAELAATPGLRAVVFRGAGDTFCAGLDLSAFQTMAGRIEELRRILVSPPPGEAANFFQKPAMNLMALPVPVIAAVTGVCYGGGMQLALAADFRIAAPDARFSIMETKWGLIPDMGITQSLPRLVRADRAKDLIMTARVLSAEEALAEGLITRIADDPAGAANDLATELAGRSPDAMRAAKALVDGSWGLPAVETLVLEARLQAEIIGRANQIEAVMANFEGRAPRYD